MLKIDFVGEGCTTQQRTAREQTSHLQGERVPQRRLVSRLWAIVGTEEGVAATPARNDIRRKP